MSTKRKNLKTAARIDAFIQALEAGASIPKAAETAGISTGTAYYWRRQDSEFAARWENAYLAGADALEGEAQRRAVQGVEEPVFHSGQVVGSVRRYSDTLLMFVLKVRNPERYCDKARTAAIMRRWAKEDEVGGGEVSVPAEFLEWLAERANAKAATANQRNETKP